MNNLDILKSPLKGPCEIALLPFTVFTTTAADYIPFLVNFTGGFHQNIKYFHGSD